MCPRKRTDISVQRCIRPYEHMGTCTVYFYIHRYLVRRSNAIDIIYIVLDFDYVHVFCAFTSLYIYGHTCTYVHVQAPWSFACFAVHNGIEVVLFIIFSSSFLLIPVCSGVLCSYLLWNGRPSRTASKQAINTKVHIDT